MNPQRQEWDVERLDALEERVTVVEKQQRGLKRALRNRPTKQQVNDRLAQLGGSATRGQIWIGVLAFAGVIGAAIITGVFDHIFNAPPPPLPTK